MNARHSVCRSEGRLKPPFCRGADGAAGFLPFQFSHLINRPLHQLGRQSIGSNPASPGNVQTDRLSIEVYQWSPALPVLKHGVMLEKPGWKAELAKRVKERLLADGPGAIDAPVMDHWEKVFAAFQPNGTTAAATAP